MDRGKQKLRRLLLAFPSLPSWRAGEEKQASNLLSPAVLTLAQSASVQGGTGLSASFIFITFETSDDRGALKITYNLRKTRSEF